MDEIAPFIAYVAALAVAAAIPGPGVASLVGRAIGARAGASLPFIVGLALGDVAFLSIAILGLSALASASSKIFLAIKILGGAYLLILAWRMWTSSIAAMTATESIHEAPLTAALSGLAVTLGNPKTVVFYLALVPNVIDMASIGALDWLVLSLLTMATLLAVLLPYAALASHLRTLLRSATALRQLNRGAAAIIAGAGGLILHDAVAGHAGPMD